MYLVFKEAKEEASNADTLIERIRSELVVKHGEHAREVQRAQRAEADVEILEQQVVIRDGHSIYSISPFI